MAKQNTLLNTVSYLALLGTLVSIYLVYAHYSDHADPFCNLGEFANCDKVNKSIYAEIFGIPVALLGVLAYSFIAFVSRLLIKKFDFTVFYKKLTPQLVKKLLLLFVMASTLFTLWLTYVELYILFSICIYCVFQQIILLIILLLMYLIVKNKQPTKII